MTPSGPFVALDAAAAILSGASGHFAKCSVTFASTSSTWSFKA